MSKQAIKQVLLSKFPFEPTQDQVALFDQLSNFFLDPEMYKLFIINGYAGTGKTTVLSTLAHSLFMLKFGVVLLAPTGRAAKVISNYTKKPAFTIHKKIYKVESNAEGVIGLNVQANTHKNTVFIIDEASMLSDYTEASEPTNTYGQNLLSDLIEYIYSGNNCFAIFSGDKAQLPPVKHQFSPALDADFLKKNYDLKIYNSEIKEVLRQAKDSGILSNATAVRKIVHQGKFKMPTFRLKDFHDIFSISGMELPDVLNQAYGVSGGDETIVITTSNKRANLFNQQIRNRILYMENELNGGDRLMVVRNNYFWLPFNGKNGFIANGDSLEVLRIKKIQELYGFKFADATVKIKDSDEDIQVDVKLLLDTLTSDAPALTGAQYKSLFTEVANDYSDITNNRFRYQKLRVDPFLNALQVKFSYTVTCHKAQGGQWEQVFVDQGILQTDKMNLEYLRWLYTAITRATTKLYLINFDSSFFKE